MGIVCGARLYEIAIIASAVVTALLFLLDLVPAAKPPYLLVLKHRQRSWNRRWPSCCAPMPGPAG